MRRVVASTNSSLDGVMEAPETWSFQFWSDELARSAEEELLACDALLLGRVTSEAFARFWPAATNEPGIAGRMNGLSKFVASTTLPDPLEWSNATLLGRNVAEDVANLKRSIGGGILLLASGDLAQTLMAHDLVDEYRLRVAPVIVGTGKRFFRDGLGTMTFRLAGTRTFDTGVAALTYQRPGHGA